MNDPGACELLLLVGIVLLLLAEWQAISFNFMAVWGWVSG